jgi:hypothetical protein
MSPQQRTRPMKGDHMTLSIKIRHRAPDPTPWKWEFYDDKRLVTASHQSFASQAEAHRFGRIALSRFKKNLSARPAGS